MTSVRRALALSFIERYALIAISLLSNILLARLLTPKEIGIYSVSLAVVGIAQVLRDFGIGNFLIQEKQLKETHISTAFGISLLIGGGLFVITYFLAPYASDFYGEDQMLLTLRITSLNFLVLPFCTISLALMRREMAFKRMLMVNLIAASFGFGVTVGLAYSGFGPNSMAIGAVAVNMVTGAVAWIAQSNRKLILPGFSEWRTLLRFGGQNSLAGIVTSISMDANDLIVAKILGFNSVAIISRAQGLMNLFHRDIMGAVRNVALPAFAAEYRAGGGLELHYIHSVAVITVIAWPFYGAMAIYSLEALRLLFGSQWDAASPLVPIFCLAGAVSSMASLIPILLVAVGRNNLATGADILLQPMRFGLIAIAAIVFRTTEACAFAFLASAIIAMPIFYKIKNKALVNDTKELVKNLASSALVTIMTLILPLLHVAYTGVSRKEPIPLSELAIIVPITVLAWILSVRISRHPLAEEPWFTQYVMSAKVFKKSCTTTAK